MQGSGSFVNDTTAIGRGGGQKCGPGQGVGYMWRGDQKGNADLIIRLMETPSSRGTWNLEMLDVVTSEPVKDKKPDRGIYIPRHLNWEILTNLTVGFPQLGFLTGWADRNVCQELRGIAGP